MSSTITDHDHAYSEWNQNFHLKCYGHHSQGLYHNRDKTARGTHVKEGGRWRYSYRSHTVFLRVCMCGEGQSKKRDNDQWEACHGPHASSSSISPLPSHPSSRPGPWITSLMVFPLTVVWSWLWGITCGFPCGFPPHSSLAECCH